ncbi:hypothetical protein LOZ55_000751 [Ophidiomyces ophidiicola]|nr:hypothetical protein LOZ55_000751 [Ophidiomyces ophidiicola]
MAVDTISPIALARIRALLLPIGKIQRSRFLEFVQRLQSQNMVRLGDVSPSGNPNKNTFSPLAFPSGMVIYDLSISVPPTSHLDLFPFELFREPLVILAIADGKELSSVSDTNEAKGYKSPDGVKHSPPYNPLGLTGLVEELNGIGNSYPKSLIRQLLIFDFVDVNELVISPADVIWIPSPAASRTTTIKTLMCDISSLLLKELGNFADSMQEWSKIDSSKASSWGPRRTTESRPTDRLRHRMTLPAHLPSQPGASSSHHSDTERNIHAAESPTTFDEITRSIQLSNRTTTSLKSSSKPGSKEHSRERMSIQGLANINERSKSRFQTRLKVVTGLLHLQAGIWPEALRELVEGASGARAGSDYIWHAKALEGILVCLILHGWLGIEFQIPQVCFPFEKSTSKLLSGSQTEPSLPSESNASCLHNLACILPDISNHILSLYNRATNITDEPLPQLVFSETTIRLAKLLTVVYIRNAKLDDNGLKNIVLNLPLQSEPLSDTQVPHTMIRRSEIASFVFRALPSSPTTEVPITDSVQILAGIAAVLSALQLERKRGFILKELISISIIGLVQARKIGAAEMGIHPAAGLSALNNEAFDLNALDIASGNTEDSMRGVLSSISAIYGSRGLKEQELTGITLNTTDQQLEYDSASSIIDRNIYDANLSSYGDISLKVNIFKACIDFCEALPDFQGVLQFTSGLLQTIKGSAMLSVNHRNIRPTLAPEEQVRLYNNIKRTVGAADRLGHPNMEAEYWDDFLLRGVKVLGCTNVKKPVLRSKKDFGISTLKEDLGQKDPFIYSAFSKVQVDQDEAIVIAGERNAIQVVLQNPFEFEIEIDSLELIGDGVAFNSDTRGLSLPPFSIEERVLPLFATTEGILTLTGCVAKIKFCRQRRFLIFKKCWKPEIQPKLKRIGLVAKTFSIERPSSWGSNYSENSSRPPQNGPRADSAAINVIKEQPILEIEYSSLSQNAITLLDGQKRTFYLTLRNRASCPADLIFVTFQDSTARHLQTAISQKDNLAVDLYELEYQLIENPAVRWKQLGTHGRPTVAANDTSMFEIQVSGKPGLNEAELQFDYGHTGVASEIPETFYTRQLNLPLAITVSPSIEVLRCDILPFHHYSTALSHIGVQSDAPISEKLLLRNKQFSTLLSSLGTSSHSADHCLLLLDLRNSWSNPLSASISVAERGDGNLDSVYGIYDVLQPSRTVRIVVPVSRVYLSDPYKAIPSLGHANKRQFVVSARKTCYEKEAAAREVFWLKERLLKSLHGTWKDETTGHEGVINLRGIKLTGEMADVLRVDQVEISFFIQSLGTNEMIATDLGHHDVAPVVRAGCSNFTVPTNTFLTLCVSIFNRSPRPIHPLLRLIPSLKYQSSAVALELSKRLSWTGMLQRALPVLAAGQTTVARLGVTALCEGEYEINALVEEVRRIRPHGIKPEENATQDMNKATNELPNFTDHHDSPFEAFTSTNSAVKRRVWHARRPCVLSAHE